MLFIFKPYLQLVNKGWKKKEILTAELEFYVGFNAWDGNGGIREFTARFQYSLVE